MGFRLLVENRWSITNEDPTLWVKICDGYKDTTFGQDSLPLGDTLSGTNPTMTEAIQTVIDDYNGVPRSYLRLALYPNDPDNPGTPAAGDSEFTLAKAATRTINICVEDPSNPFIGGHAKQKTSGNVVTGCDIVFSNSVLEDNFNFLATATHEIGHCIGLDHPMDTQHAIMSYFEKDDMYRLQIDDRMGLVHLFPLTIKDGVPMDPKERNTFGLSCSVK